VRCKQGSRERECTARRACVQEVFHGCACMQDLFGEVGSQLAAQGLARLAELMLDDTAPGPKLGNLARALLASRRAGRVVHPLCFTAVQQTHSETYFAAHFVEDRLPPHSGSYHDFLSSLQRRISVR
jgi:hypothetical protein